MVNILNQQWNCSETQMHERMPVTFLSNEIRCEHQRSSHPWSGKHSVIDAHENIQFSLIAIKPGLSKTSIVRTSLVMQWLRLCLATGLIPGRRVTIPRASGPKKQNIKQKRYHNKFNKVFSKQKSGKWDGRKFCDVHVVEKNVAQSRENLSVEK